MKQLLLTLACLTAATQLQAQQIYAITGTATGYDGLKVRLTDENKQTIDSTVVTDGTFSLTGPLKVQPATLRIGESSETFLLTERPLKVGYRIVQKERRGKKVDVADISIEGDSDQTLFKEMNNALLFESMSMLALAFGGDEMTESMRDSIGQMYVAAKEVTKHTFDSIATNFPDSYVSALIINNNLSKERSYADLKPLVDQLSPRVKASAVGLELEKTMQMLNALSLGSLAPDFTLSTPDGQQLSLSSLRGKVLLVDFWASWCGPCLREAPNIRKVYADYKDKGFEVLSVSLDDKRDNWLAAIEKHQLGWKHVSSLQGWKCPVAKLYNVTAIPAMVLLDKEGRIVSTNARGEKLREEVSKLCQ